MGPRRERSVADLGENAAEQTLCCARTRGRGKPRVRGVMTTPAGSVHTVYDRRSVTILDEITFATDDVDGWLARWRSEYAPAAQARGLELVAIWAGGTRDPQRSTIVIQWRVTSIREFWASRQTAAADSHVASFWAATDAIALGRDRRVLRPLELS